MSDSFPFNNYVYQQDDQRTPDESNIPVHLFPEAMYEYSPIRLNTSWDAFHEIEYYPSPEYPHPLMVCPPAPGSFEDLTYARREFQSPDDSLYLSTESSPAVSALITTTGEDNDSEDEPKNLRDCKVESKPVKKSDKESRKSHQTRSKERKKCHNCLSTKSPSWRRSISGPHEGCLLCNACGLYEKTSKSKRMLVSDEEGVLKVVRKRDKPNYVCYHCGIKDSTRWKKFQHKLYCEKCAKAHSKI